MTHLLVHKQLEKRTEESEKSIGKDYPGLRGRRGLYRDEKPRVNARLFAKARKLAEGIAKALGVISVYYNSDIDIEFDYTGNGVEESAEKQYGVKLYRKYEKYVELMTVIDDVISNAYLVEVHNEDDYQADNPGHKFNEYIKSTYVLVSAFEDEHGIVPVKMSIMTYKDGHDDPKLHVMISLPEIEKTKIIAEQGIKSSASATSFSNYNLGQILAEVKKNPKSQELGKYLPDEFLESNLSTSDLEIKRSLPETDSEGNQLSEQQKEYFINT